MPGTPSTARLRGTWRPSSLYDLAVETGAKAAAAAQPPPASFPGGGYLLPKRPARSLRKDLPLPAVLDELLASARHRAGDDRLDVGVIRDAARLHEARNRIQHESEVPTPDAIATARARALALLSWSTETFFGMEFERLSRATLVRNDTVRNLIEKAERQAADEDLDLAAGSVAIALEFARLEFRTGQRYSDRRQPLRPTNVNAALSEIRKGGGDPHGMGYRQTKELLITMASTIEVLADRVEALSLGARASDYDWFRRHFPQIGRTVSSRAEGGFDLHPRTVPAGMTRAIYERGRDFVVDAALHWQQFPAPPEIGNASG